MQRHENEVRSPKQVENASTDMIGSSLLNPPTKYQSHILSLRCSSYNTILAHEANYENIAKLEIKTDDTPSCDVIFYDITSDGFTSKDVMEQY